MHTPETEASIKHLVLKQLNRRNKTIDAGVLVYDGHEQDPIERPREAVQTQRLLLHIFTGRGVSTGWRLVLRSLSTGPYRHQGGDGPEQYQCERSAPEAPG